MHAGRSAASDRLEHEPVGIDSSLGSAIAVVLPPVALMVLCLVHQLML